MSIYNMGRDTVRKHMVIFGVLTSCLSILYGKLLTECGGSESPLQFCREPGYC